MSEIREVPLSPLNPIAEGICIPDDVNAKEIPVVENKEPIKEEPKIEETPAPIVKEKPVEEITE